MSAKAVSASAPGLPSVGMSAAQRMKSALAWTSSAQMRSLSDVAGVPVRVGAKAKRGMSVGAGAYLRLCAAIGIDPVDGSERPASPRPEAHMLWWFLGAGLITTRFLRGHSVRDAAVAAGTSFATISRAENARSVATESVLKLAAYIGVPAASFLSVQCVSASISHETPSFRERRAKP